MFQIDDIAWAIIYKFDSPKEVKIKNFEQIFFKDKHTTLNYVVEYKHKEFIICNYELYPDKKSADIFWSILILQDYEETLQYPELFLTDEFEFASLKAKQLLSKYIETDPELILKYL